MTLHAWLDWVASKMWSIKADLGLHIAMYIVTVSGECLSVMSNNKTVVVIVA